MDLPIKDENFDTINSAGVTLSKSQFIRLCNILVHMSSVVSFGSRVMPQKIGFTVKFVSLRYKMEFKQGIQLVYTHFIWIIIPDCFGHLCADWAASPNAQKNMTFILSLLLNHLCIGSRFLYRSSLWSDLCLGSSSRIG